MFEKLTVMRKTVGIFLLFVVAILDQGVVPETTPELKEAARAHCVAQRGSDLPLKEFSTDGCSLWFDGPWVGECIAHDMMYWCGGTKNDRTAADIELRRNINAAYYGVGTLMYYGVRLGGGPLTPFPWRFGYGWPLWKGYDRQ